MSELFERVRREHEEKRRAEVASIDAEIERLMRFVRAQESALGEEEGRIQEALRSGARGVHDPWSSGGNLDGGLPTQDASTTSDRWHDIDGGLRQARMRIQSLQGHKWPIERRDVTSDVIGEISRGHHAAKSALDELTRTRHSLVSYVAAGERPREDLDSLDEKIAAARATFEEFDEALTVARERQDRAALLSERNGLVEKLRAEREDLTVLLDRREIATTLSNRQSTSTEPDPDASTDAERWAEGRTGLTAEAVPGWREGPQQAATTGARPPDELAELEGRIKEQRRRVAALEARVKDYDERLGITRSQEVA